MKGTSQNLEEAIRIEAYLLSEKAGHPAHLEKSFWVQAEAIVHGRIAVMAPTGKAAVVKAKAPAASKATKPKAVAKAKAAPAAVTAPLPLTGEDLAPAKPASTAGKPKAAVKAPKKAGKK